MSRRHPQRHIWLPRASGTAANPMADFAGAGDAFILNAFVPQMQPRELVHAMPVVPASSAKLITIVSSNGVIVRPCCARTDDVIFQVLANFQDARSTSSAFKRDNASASGICTGVSASRSVPPWRKRHITRFTGATARREADQPRGHSFQTVGLGIKGDIADFAWRGNPAVKRR